MHCRRWACLSRFAGACCCALSASPAAAQWLAIPLESSSSFHSSQVNAVTDGAQGGEGVFGTGVFRPLLWNGAASSWMDLSPTTSGGGRILGMAGGEQVGQFTPGAALWHGTPQSWVNLHPAGAFVSAARATNGAEQVGDVTISPGGFPQAALWHGSAQSYVNLQPPGAIQSIATSVDQGRQGGGISLPGFVSHAGLWSGTAASFVDLHPVGADFLESGINGMAAGQQAGWSRRQSAPNIHAAIWAGTASSWADLNPPGAGLSILLATCGVAQAGYANLSGTNSAGVWFGTPGSFVNLAASLPPGLYYESNATSVAVSGSTAYVGGYATSVNTSQREAFLWIGPVPAPPGLALLAGAGLLAARRRARGRLLPS